MPARFTTAVVRVLARFAFKLWRPEDHPRDPRTGRFIPKPGGPKRRRRPTARNHAVTAGAWSVVEKARKAMPTDRAGWRAHVARTLPEERRVDQQIRQIEEQLAEARKKLREAEKRADARLRRRRVPKEERAEAREYETRLERGEVARLERTLADWQKGRDDPTLGERQPWAVVVLPAREEPRYPTDKQGNVIAPPEYEQALDDVLAAGEAIFDEFHAARLRDKVIHDLDEQLAGPLATRVIWDTPAGDERMAKLRQRKETMRTMRKREQEILVQLLASVRKFGGAAHVNTEPWTAQVGETLPARDDWQRRLDDAEEFFPTDWLRRSAENRLVLASADRAFHRNLGGGTMLAMPTAGRDADAYTGAFPDQTAEVVVHEMGHRMEVYVPGLKELEFTFVRRRATENGKLEPIQSLRDLYGNGYDEWERTYKDRWANAYAGKTYEKAQPVGDGEYVADDPDPAAQAWEVFQVGLQDTFGRSGTSYGGIELKFFTLGVLATLARQEPKPASGRRRR